MTHCRLQPIKELRAITEATLKDAKIQMDNAYDMLEESHAKDDILTPDERHIISLLTEVWNKYVELEIIARGDRTRFSNHIDALHDIVMARPAMRSLQKHPIKTGE